MVMKVTNGPKLVSASRQANQLLPREFSMMVPVDHVESGDLIGSLLSQTTDGFANGVWLPLVPKVGWHKAKQ